MQKQADDQAGSHQILRVRLLGRGFVMRVADEHRGPAIGGRASTMRVFGGLCSLDLSGWNGISSSSGRFFLRNYL